MLLLFHMPATTNGFRKGGQMSSCYHSNSEAPSRILAPTCPQFQLSLSRKQHPEKSHSSPMHTNQDFQTYTFNVPILGTDNHNILMIITGSNMAPHNWNFTSEPLLALHFNAMYITRALFNNLINIY